MDLLKYNTVVSFSITGENWIAQNKKGIQTERRWLCPFISNLPQILLYQSHFLTLCNHFLVKLSVTPLTKNNQKLHQSTRGMDVSHQEISPAHDSFCDHVGSYCSCWL